jgi:hypothetical protein
MMTIRAHRLFDGVDAEPVERPVVLIETGRTHLTALTAVRAVFRAGIRVR